MTTFDSVLTPQEQLQITLRAQALGRVYVAARECHLHRTQWWGRRRRHKKLNWAIAEAVVFYRMEEIMDTINAAREGEPHVRQ